MDNFKEPYKYNFKSRSFRITEPKNNFNCLTMLNLCFNYIFTQSLILTIHLLFHYLSYSNP